MTKDIKTDSSNTYNGFNEEEGRCHDIVKKSVDFYMCNYYPSRFNAIKAKFQVNVDEKLQTIKHFDGGNVMSCQRYPITDMTHDAFKNEVISQNYTPKLLSLHKCNKEYSSDAQDAYDWAYHISKFETEVSDAVYSEAILIGDSYVQRGYEKNDGYMIPKAEHISFFEMFLEPMATSFESSRHKIVRKIMHSVDVIKKYKHVTDWSEDTFIEGTENRNALAETASHSIINADFSKIWDVESWVDAYRDVCQSQCVQEEGVSAHEVIQNYFKTGDAYENVFGFKEDSALCEVVEIRCHEEEGYTVKILVNGHILPFKKRNGKRSEGPIYEYCPFGNIYFEESIGSPVHRGVAQKLAITQKKADMLQFIIDNAFIMHAYPDYIAYSGLELGGVEVKNLTYTGASTVYKTTNKNIQNNQGFKAIEYVGKDIVAAAEARLDKVIQEGFAQLGLNSYTLGTDGRVERLSSALKERVSQSRARLNTFKKSASTALNRSYYIRIPNFTKKTSTGLLERIDDDGHLSLQDLDVKNIINNYEVVISSEGFREESNGEYGQNMMNAFSAVQPLLDEGRIDPYDVLCAVTAASGLDSIPLRTDKEVLAHHKKTVRLALNKEQCTADVQKEFADDQAKKQEKEQIKQQKEFDKERNNQLGINQVDDASLREALYRADQIQENQIQPVPTSVNAQQAGFDQQVFTDDQGIVIPGIQQ